MTKNMKKANNSTPFERYLIDKLLQSGEDCCKLCAILPRKGLCEAFVTDVQIDYEVCHRGIREYFEARKRNETSAKNLHPTLL